MATRADEKGPPPQAAATTPMERATPTPAPGADGLGERERRIRALRRFATSITAFNVLGHLWLGFEQPWVQPLVAMAVAYGLELGIETVDAAAERRRPRYAEDGPGGFVDFLLPAHITALAVGMLLYANSRMLPIAFAVAVAITTKAVIRVGIEGRPRHVFNPSNIGIATTLVAFPSVGIAPPYHFTERVSGPLDWVIPAVILVSGLVLNLQLTRKGPLIAGWLGGFAAQAVIRTLITGTSTVAALLPMTGVAFILFTNYMITDPGTTPVRPRNQLLFGLATAAAYGLLVAAHVSFGLFFALALTAGARGLVIAAANASVAVRARARRREPIDAHADAMPVGPSPTPAPAAAAGPVRSQVGS